MAETPDRHTRRTRHRVATLGNAPNLAGMEQKQERMTTDAWGWQRAQRNGVTQSRHAARRPLHVWLSHASTSPNPRTQKGSPKDEAPTREREAGEH